LKLQNNIEHALIAALLLRPESISEIRLEDSDFLDAGMGVIYKTMQELSDEGRPITVPMVKARIGANDYGFGDLRALEAFAFGPVQPDPIDLAQLVSEASRDRSLRLIAADFAEQIENPSIDKNALVQQTKSAMDECVAMVGGATDSLGSMADFKIEMHDFLNNDRDMLCSTGIPHLDDAIGGWQRSNYLVLGARPGMGKSTVAVDFAIRTAQRGVGVLVFSLEMSSRVTWVRMLSALTKLGSFSPATAYKTLLHSKETDAQRNAANLCATAIRDLPVSVIHPRVKTPEALLADAQRVKRSMEAEGYELGLVIVDHMGKMTSSSKNKNQNKTNEVGEISNGLANLSRAMNLQVIAASQLNRASVQGDNKRPDLTSLRNSGDIEQDADAVLFLHREEYYLEQAGRPEVPEEAAEWDAAMDAARGRIEILVSKSRNGEVGLINLGADMAHSILTPPPIHVVRAA
jgi:replicative DNA helicase